MVAIVGLLSFSSSYQVRGELEGSTALTALLYLTGFKQSGNFGRRQGPLGRGHDLPAGFTGIVIGSIRSP